MTKNSKRPVFLNLFQIHLPVTAVVSLAHRATGIFLFFLLPFVIYFFGLSLQNEQGYLKTLEFLRQPLPLSLLILIFWFLCHHLLAGIRYLLIDIDIGVSVSTSRTSAWLVIIAGIMAVLIVAMVFS